MIRPHSETPRFFERLGNRVDAWLEQRRKNTQVVAIDKTLKRQQEFLNTQVFAHSDHLGESPTMGSSLTVRNVQIVESDEEFFEVSLVCTDATGKCYLIDYIEGIGQCSFAPCDPAVLSQRLLAQKLRLEAMTLNS